MNINRNNYENFFLLYADGELWADERIAVDNFIAANEDLRIELKMIQAAILPLEEIVFIDKSFLYKQPVFDNGLQEKLLMKIDNELALAEAVCINEMIASNVNIQKEFGLLQRTKLDAAEKIVFEEKHLLYRKERGNVISFGWVRWAAAAIFIGCGLFFGIKLLNNKTEITTRVAAVNKPTEKKNNIIVYDTLKNSIENIATTSTKANTVIENITTENKENIANNALGETKNGVAAPKSINIKKDIGLKSVVPNKEIIVVPKKEEQTQIANNNNKFLPDAKLISVEKIAATEKKSVIIASINNTTKEIKQPIINNENIVPLENNYVRTVLMNTEEKSNNKILYMDEDAVKHSKAGGFFRKIKRFVERTANIKTGNTLQIAGFEIASR